MAMKTILPMLMLTVILGLQLHGGGSAEAAGLPAQPGLCGRYSPVACDNVTEYCEPLTQRCSHCSNRCWADFPDDYCSGACPNYMAYLERKKQEEQAAERAESKTSTAIPDKDAPVQDTQEHRDIHVPLWPYVLLAVLGTIAFAIIIMAVGYVIYRWYKARKPDGRGQEEESMLDPSGNQPEGIQMTDMRASDQILPSASHTTVQETAVSVPPPGEENESGRHSITASGDPSEENGSRRPSTISPRIPRDENESRRPSTIAPRVPSEGNGSRRPSTIAPSVPSEVNGSSRPTTDMETRLGPPHTTYPNQDQAAVGQSTLSRTTDGPYDQCDARLSNGQSQPVAGTITATSGYVTNELNTGSVLSDANNELGRSPTRNTVIARETERGERVHYRDMNRPRPIVHNPV